MFSNVKSGLALLRNQLVLLAQDPAGSSLVVVVVFAAAVAAIDAAPTSNELYPSSLSLALPRRFHVVLCCVVLCCAAFRGARLPTVRRGAAAACG